MAEPAKRTQQVNPWRILGVFAFPFFTLSVVCSLDRFWWQIEDLASFRLQFLVVAVPFALAYLFGRRWKTAGIAVVCVLLHGVPIAPLFFGASDAAGGGQSVRFVVFNVHTENEQRGRALAYLRAARADVLVLVEVDDEWLTAMAPLQRTHPYSVLEPRFDNFGIALFSRHPIEDGHVESFGRSSPPSIVARLRDQGLTLVATHPVPPVADENVESRNAQMDAVARYAARRRGPLAVMGDFNMTPWSPTFRQLVAGSRLHDSVRGFGWQPTWPAGAPQFWIPIDHVLVSPDIRVVDRHVGPDLGSDHYPVVIDLQLPRRRRPS